MAAYVIANIEVVDQAGYDEYRSQVQPTLITYGARYLVRGGATEVMEGGWSPKRCVLIEFPDMARCKAWYSSPEYTPLRALRERSTKSSVVFAEGA